MPATPVFPSLTRTHRVDHPEAFIAGARVVIAGSIAAIVWTGSQAPPHLVPVTHVIATVYAAVTLLVLFASASKANKSLIFLGDLCDVTFPAGIALLTGGTNSPYYVLYIWV